MGEQPERQSPTAASRATAATTPLLSPPPDEPNACLSSPLTAGSFSPCHEDVLLALQAWLFCRSPPLFSKHSPRSLPAATTPPPLAPRLKVRTQLPAAPCPAAPAHTHPSGALSQGKGKEETTRCQGKRAKRPSAGPTAPAACPQQAQPVPQEPQFTPQFVPTLLGAPGAA